MRNGIFAGLMLGVLATTAWAEVHRCKDAAGKTYFSDRGCTGTGEKMRGAPGGDAHTIGTAEDDRRLALACLEQYRRQSPEATPENTRLNDYRIRWVSVRGIGARRLIEIKVGQLNAAGFWAGATQHQCLLRGDNVTFQPPPYELVD